MAQPKRPKKSTPIPNSPFWQTLLHALENATDAQALGADSPLAAPYLLGSHLLNAKVGPSERGQILQTILRQSIHQIDGKNGDRYQQLLTEYYFSGQSVQAVCDSIGLGKTTFHANRKAAISLLEPILINEFQPAIQLEKPMPVVAPFIGRAAHSRILLLPSNLGRAFPLPAQAGLAKQPLRAICTVQTQRRNAFGLPFGWA